MDKATEHQSFVVKFTLFVSSVLSFHTSRARRPRTDQPLHVPAPIPYNNTTAAPRNAFRASYAMFFFSVRRASNAELADTAIVFLCACVRMRVVTRWRTRSEGSWEEEWPTVSKGG